jgi:hypothetical protein
MMRVFATTSRAIISSLFGYSPFFGGHPRRFPVPSNASIARLGKSRSKKKIEGPSPY